MFVCDSFLPVDVRWRVIGNLNMLAVLHVRVACSVLFFHNTTRRDNNGLSFAVGVTLSIFTKVASPNSLAAA
jgi:hypothetical protein